MVARTLIPQTPLLVCEPFGRQLPAGSVGAALARGLAGGGAAEPDLCPLPRARGSEEIARLLAIASFDARMLESRAVVIAARTLDPRGLAGSIAFELATRARQSGVPAYAVAARNRLSSFDARVLDLQVVLEAGTAPALERAGRELAAII